MSNDGRMGESLVPNIILAVCAVCTYHLMGLLPNTENSGLRMRWEHRGRFSRHRGLAIRHASRHVRDARAIMHAGIAN